MTNVALAGATGAVGKATAPLLVQSGYRLQTLNRRSDESFPADAIYHVAEPRIWPQLVSDAQPDVAISCLGTTIRLAGSQDAFRSVDYDLVLAVAEAAKKAGARQFITVSSVGASSKSSSFYLKTKGQLEDAIAGLGFARVDILRPGLLVGANRQESRPGESLAALLAPLTDLLMVGGLSRYRSTPVTAVAKAIVALTGMGGDGSFVHENDSIITLAG